jgi:hypothetical protein
MALTPDVNAIKAEIKSEFPAFTVVNKADSTLMKLLSHVMVSTFMTNFTTTIGNTVYVPDEFESWSPASQCAVLRHERVHMRQARRLTFPLFAFLYLLVFFPLGLAYFRAKFEMEAYAESLAAYKDYGRSYSDAETKAWVTGEFTGASYGWMWPFSSTINAWFDSTVAALDATDVKPS